MALDVIFGIVILLGTIRGIKMGFARQVLSLAGIVLGILFAHPVAEHLQPLAATYVNNVPVGVQMAGLSIASLFLIWGVIVLCGSLYLGWYRRTVLGTTSPSSGDRIVGATLGLAKSVLAVCMLVFLMDRLPENFRSVEIYKQAFDNSKCVSVCHDYHVMDRLLELPEVNQFKDNFVRIFEHLKPGDKDKQPATEQVERVVSGLEEALR